MAVLERRVVCLIDCTTLIRGILALGKNHSTRHKSWHLIRESTVCWIKAICIKRDAPKQHELWIVCENLISYWSVSISTEENRPTLWVCIFANWIFPLDVLLYMICICHKAILGSLIIRDSIYISAKPEIVQVYTHVSLHVSDDTSTRGASQQ